MMQKPFPFIRNNIIHPSHQLAFLTPGIFPSIAFNRKQYYSTRLMISFNLPNSPIAHPRHPKIT